VGTQLPKLFNQSPFDFAQESLVKVNPFVVSSSATLNPVKLSDFVPSPLREKPVLSSVEGVRMRGN